MKLEAIIAANGGPTFFFMPMVLTLNIQQANMGIWYSGVYILLAMYCNILQFPSQLMVINSVECFCRGTNINYKLY